MLLRGRAVGSFGSGVRVGGRLLGRRRRFHSRGRGGSGPLLLHLALALLEQLEIGCLTRVAETALVALDNPRVAALAIGEARPEFGEKAADGLLVVQPGYGQAASVEIALLGQGDELFDERAGF